MWAWRKFETCKQKKVLTHDGSHLSRTRRKRSIWTTGFGAEENDGVWRDQSDWLSTGFEGRSNRRPIWSIWSEGFKWKSDDQSKETTVNRRDLDRKTWSFRSGDQSRKKMMINRRAKTTEALANLSQTMFWLMVNWQREENDQSSHRTRLYSIPALIPSWEEDDKDFTWFSNAYVHKKLDLLCYW